VPCGHPETGKGELARDSSSGTPNQYGNEKMKIATANPVTFEFYDFFSVKIRGTYRWTS
jgi:hypothetical protein